MINQKKKEATIRPPFFMSYFITDPIEFGDEAPEFEKNLRNTFSSYNIDIVCFRDKTSLNKEELANSCLKIAREYGIKKVLINSDIVLCKKLGFDGIHFNSLQFRELKNFTRSNLFISISCHNENEILLAKKHKIDAVTYSPIFFKEKKGLPKGIDNLKAVVKKHQTNNFFIFALGGIISDSHIQKVLETDAKGFASIRYFKV